MLVPFVATLVVGCSGDSGAVTLDEWASEICSARDTVAGAPAPTSLTDLAAFERVAGTFDEAVANLDEFNPPDSARDHHRNLVQFYRDISSVQRDFIDAATNADTATVNVAASEYQAELDQVFSDVELELPTELEDALRNAGRES